VNEGTGAQRLSALTASSGVDFAGAAEAEAERFHFDECEGAAVVADEIDFILDAGGRCSCATRV